jgi:hypothetical protein
VAECEWLSKIDAFYATLRPTTDIKVVDGWSTVTVNRLRHVQTHFPDVRLVTGVDIVRSPETLGFNLVALSPQEFYYAFPCYSLGGRMLGLSLRAVRKEFRSHYALVDEGFTRNMPFGFYGLPKWKAKKYADPVWVCEGIFDALSLMEVHPYVVAAFGGSLTWGKIQTISLLSSSVVCYFDSDEKGKKLYEQFKTVCHRVQPGVVVTLGKLGDKDPGAYLDKGKMGDLNILAAWNRKK